MDQSPAHAGLLERLRARGWRITPQRRAVAQVLAGGNVHPTAEQIFEQARTVVPEISLATVYNTLRELVTIDEVVEVTAGPGAVRYDTNVAGSHQHLSCLGCGDLVDVRPAGEGGLSLEDDHGYTITKVNITFQGYCPACAPAAGRV
jgi:Fur family transcriptional regulator, stress-responsive regulator